LTKGTRQPPKLIAGKKNQTKKACGKKASPGQGTGERSHKKRQYFPSQRASVKSQNRLKHGDTVLFTRGGVQNQQMIEEDIDCQGSGARKNGGTKCLEKKEEKTSKP